ncbi:hypothetical protein E4M02_04375 [Brevundimonas sp. S30B]|uniref:hypothetical protein n=1 Tax=unclassified Brevundimonas TaxID=2622653 RepID=UPI0010724887|nr:MULTISPECIES: hypothetical protein [unclassified Brevundimonas]QBX36893.1 hypothetical protein E4M01_03440 [Brevundimonas sp. MF30-B]TFW04312.1 hypothetical protein E4M02_04375 [Brevundimonas sp. S30B]
MGDFEDTYGAGADASEIIDGNSHSREWNKIKEGWQRDREKRNAEMKNDPTFIAMREDFRARQGSGKPIVTLTEDEQDARRRAIETATRLQAERMAALAKAKKDSSQS